MRMLRKMAIVVANFLTELSALWDGAFLVLLGLGFFHYYSEGIIWKRNTIHRAHVFVR